MRFFASECIGARLFLLHTHPFPYTFLVAGMASILSRASRFSSPITARSLLRASRSGIILPQFGALLVTFLAYIAVLMRGFCTVTQRDVVRWSSAFATAPVDEHRSPSSFAAAPSHVSASEHLEETHSAIEDDQPLFSALEGKVSPGTLKAITVSPMQLTHMSPVQDAVLNLLPELVRPYNPEDSSKAPRDLLVKARTGTGKTIAFLVPAIESRLAEIKRYGAQAKQDSGLDSRFEVRARRSFAHDQAGVVIISPTRELATQIAVEATKLVKHHTELQVHLLVGGGSKRNQLKDWMRSTRDIVVCTPGRMRDLLENEPDVAGPISKSKMVSTSSHTHDLYN